MINSIKGFTFTLLGESIKINNKSKSVLIKIKYGYKKQNYNKNSRYLPTIAYMLGVFVKYVG